MKNKISITSAIALIFSIVSILAALHANRLAFVSLLNSYTPWLRITGVELLEIDPNTVEVKYVCKNFANGPALNLDITITILGKSTTERLYNSDVSMPNDESTRSSYINLHGTYQPEVIIEKLKQGEDPIIFDICFKDIFGRRIKIRQEWKYIKGVLHITEYKVDGTSSFWRGLFNIFAF
ncbi:MAG: hypothetical protein PHP01_02010 [Phycisphaerae bacterium]|nr:hypothetical protein [Phycisphaerae bacterium]